MTLASISPTGQNGHPLRYSGRDFPREIPLKSCGLFALSLAMITHSLVMTLSLSSDTVFSPYMKVSRKDAEFKADFTAGKRRRPSKNPLPRRGFFEVRG